MSLVMVNNSIPVEGKFTFTVSYERSLESIDIVSIKGVFVSGAGNLKQITSLENDRYLITGIFVTEKEYGSEDNNIAYHFVAKQYAMSDKMREVKTANVG